MTETSDLDDESLASALVLHIDRVCDRFEVAWSAGLRPSVEQFLDDTPEPGRSVLLRELLAVTQAYTGTAANRAAPVDLAGAPASPQPTIPGYELIEMVGQGGMGVVYAARQLSLRRRVALKIGLGGRPGWARFQQEAEAIARLEHPHIVRIYDFGENNGLPYFSMEWIEGGDLARRITAGPFPPRAAAELTAKLADAIHYAHQRGILHRDLKPANVLLTPEGSPKIADFGLAKSLDSDRGLTDSDQLVGTLRYMAPEQASGKARAVGPRTDIYAVGAILYELLTGQPPYRGETWLETLDQIRYQSLTPPSALRAEVPAALEAICLKCLAKDQDERYANAQELADDLHRFLQSSSSAPGGVGQVSSPRAVPRRSRRRMLAALAALGLLIVTGMALTSFFRTTNQPASETPTAIVQIVEFRLSHHRGEEATFLGDVGSVSSTARSNDDVRAHVKLSGPAHCFLIAYNPDGSEQLCHPADPGQPPLASAAFAYPAQSTSYFGLTDGAGLQAFVLLVSSRPLPAYAEWRSQRGPIPWRPQIANGVWRFDGQQLELLAGRRGTERSRGGPPAALQELVDFCKARSGADAVAVLAFPVEPEE